MIHLSTVAALWLGGCLLVGAAGHAAEAPLADASLEELRARLTAAPASASLGRSFRPTAPPSTDGLCPGAQASGPTGRNLEVVPYAGDSAPGVNLAIQFDSGSDRIRPGSLPLLNRVATLLKEPAQHNRRFAVAGHTDAVGSAAINLQLSCARALAVRGHLLARGVPAERISAYGFGSSRPLEPGDQASAQNRRVEIRAAE